MERKCWECGNIAEHEDSVVPHVLCTKCGSQDTRLTRKKVSNNDGLESVAAQIAVAIAGISRDDYRATVDAISGQLERFGISQLQRARN